jgi:hypothetical protein
VYLFVCPGACVWGSRLTGFFLDFINITLKEDRETKKNIRAKKMALIKENDEREET